MHSSFPLTITILHKISTLYLSIKLFQGIVIFSRYIIFCILYYIVFVQYSVVGYHTSHNSIIMLSAHSPCRSSCVVYIGTNFFINFRSNSNRLIVYSFSKISYQELFTRFTCIKSVIFFRVIVCSNLISPFQDKVKPRVMPCLSNKSSTFITLYQYSSEEIFVFVFQV